MSDLSFLVPVAAILAWPITVVGKAIANRRPPDDVGFPPRAAAHLDMRLARLEQAVEAIAVEVERVAEGQRFLAQVHASQPPAVSAPPPGAGYPYPTPR